MRKILIFVMLVVVIWGCYSVISSGFSIGNITIASYSEIQDTNKELETAISELERKNDTEFKSKQTSLGTSIKNYQEKKEEYETMLLENDNAEEIIYTSADVYNIDFLWTIIGNYATEEGITLKFDVIKSTSVATSEVTSGTIKYIICDLNFTITGDYIGLTDFIYDIEDDDRLGFEISGFTMEKTADKLQVAFSVNGVPINSENLSALTTSVTSPTEEIDTTETNTTNTNTTSTTNTNTTNTTNAQT